MQHHTSSLFNPWDVHVASQWICNDTSSYTLYTLLASQQIFNFIHNARQPVRIIPLYAQSNHVDIAVSKCIRMSKQWYCSPIVLTVLQRLHVELKCFFLQLSFTLRATGCCPELNVSPDLWNYREACMTCRKLKWKRKSACNCYMYMFPRRKGVSLYLHAQ